MTQHPAFPIAETFARLDSARAWSGDWFDMRSQDVSDFLTAFGQRAPVPVVRQKIGRSVQGRALETIRFGTGRRRVFVWARQHGDETECTAALCLVLHELATHPERPEYRAILERLDLLVFANVNPDGMDLCTRQNAIGIDLNREATHLAMPEAQALVRLKDEFAPEFSFNLHDMCARKARESRTDAGLVSLAFQAGPFDETNADNDVRLRAKTIIARIHRDLQAVTPIDSMCVYKAFYMHRAFGDSMMRWGVPCVLIESGSWYPDKGGEEHVIRLHALALLASLYYVAIGADEPFDAPAYDAIPFDIATHEFDGLLRGPRLVDSRERLLFRSDLGFQTELQDYRTDADRQYVSNVKNLGDLSEENAAVQWNLDGGVLVPGLIGLAPNLVAGDALPTAEQVRPFLAAGFTTLALAFGPFADAASRRAFVEKCLVTPPPIHVAPFERVASPDDITALHGMTELHGFVTPSLRLADAGRARVAAACGLPADALAGIAALRLWFVGGASPRATRLHLSAADSAAAPLDVASLEALVRDLLADPARQVTCSAAPGSARLGVAPTAFESAAPAADFLAANLIPARADLAARVHDCTWLLAHGLALPRRGVLRPRSLADIVLIPDALAQDSPPPGTAPRLTILNGIVAVEPDNPAREQSPRGMYILPAH
ncbi:MAG: hypothetical protein KF858_07760 [Candidatus Sumerlaeia bacterium]|nr:hypothetical protein [Candidatus Sumerlaeia bacterium]